MKRMLVLLFLVSTTFLFARERQLLRNDSTESFVPTSPSSREEIILHEVDFEGDVSGWTTGNSGGWELSEVDSHSPTHSYNSPDVNNSGEFASYDLFSETISLPELGDGEIMHFKFWLYADMPDFSQEDNPFTPNVDESSYLADYYIVSVRDINESAWHISDFNSNLNEGSNWWCGNEDDNGYLDNWYQYLDTPEITIGPNTTLSADMKWAIEDFNSVNVAGTCADGWDQANVQISTDSGLTWSVIPSDSDPYDFQCGYGSLSNGFEGMPGWGDIEDWHNVTFDLSDYSNQTIKIRFAFYSDVGWSVGDDAELTGLQVDNIEIYKVFFSDTLLKQ